MESFLVSTGVVTLGEIGDKTQLLALMLAAKYRRPWTIVLGILVATTVNHALAGVVGGWITQWIGPGVMRWILGVSFIAMGLWVLVPDQLDETDDEAKHARLGVFGATVVLFFLAEMGDKTQLATVALAARFGDAQLFWVVAGTTLGMLIANVPAVIFGSRVADRLPLRAIRAVAASLFVGLGGWVLLFG